MTANSLEIFTECWCNDLEKFTRVAGIAGLTVLSSIKKLVS